MAKVKFNPALQAVSGNIGGMIVKNYSYGQVLSPRPDMSGVQRSAKQLASAERMRRAARLYHEVMADPVRREEYARRAADAGGVPIPAITLQEVSRQEREAAATTSSSSNEALSASSPNSKPPALAQSEASPLPQNDPALLRPRYLIVLKEGSVGVFTTGELLPGDIASADVGTADIIRLHDLARYNRGAWEPVPAGIPVTPDLGKDGLGERMHVHPGERGA